MPGQINVLLATYNGARFLREQLESLQCQTQAPHRILVRDDGSTDETTKILSEWTVSRCNGTVFAGENLGVTGNFFALLRNSDAECDYFSFADQDDVWLPDKIERAIAALRPFPSDMPLMYCSRVEFVDESLKHLGYSRIPKRVGFSNALVENIAVGCTVVLNRRARDMVCERVPRVTLMHDWWCYLVVSAFGKVVYDARHSVKYRQHSANVSGGTSSPLELFKRRLVRFVQRPPNAVHISDQALEFQRCFGNMLDSDQKRILEDFLSVRGGLWKRARYSTVMDVWRQTWMDTTILRTLILMGRV